MSCITQASVRYTFPRMKSSSSSRDAQTSDRASRGRYSQSRLEEEGDHHVGVWRSFSGGEAYRHEPPSMSDLHLILTALGYFRLKALSEGIGETFWSKLKEEVVTARKCLRNWVLTTEYQKRMSGGEYLVEG